MDKTTCMELAAKLRSYWETVNVYDTMVKANDLACCLQGALTSEAEDGGWLHEFLRAIGPECGGEPDEALPTRAFLDSLGTFIEEEPGCFIDAAQGIEACSRSWEDGIVEFTDGTVFEFAPCVHPETSQRILAAQGENPLKASAA